MPYIKQEDRDRFNKLLTPKDYLYGDICIMDLLSKQITTDGELNYVVSKLLHNLIETRGKNYQHLNNLIGVLECIKQEFYRTIITEYEEIKRKENGDV